MEEGKAKLGFYLARRWNRGEENEAKAVPKAEYLAPYDENRHKPINRRRFKAVEEVKGAGFTSFCHVSFGDAVKIVGMREDASIFQVEETGLGGWDVYPYADYFIHLPPGTGITCCGGIKFDFPVKKTPIRLKIGESITLKRDPDFKNAWLFTAFGSVSTAAGVTIPDFDIVRVKSEEVTLSALQDCAFALIESNGQPEGVYAGVGALR